MGEEVLISGGDVISMDKDGNITQQLSVVGGESKPLPDGFIEECIEAAAKAMAEALGLDLTRLHDHDYLTGKSGR